jgi:ABC-type spermidine/putrescine transport system permease subunit I
VEAAVSSGVLTRRRRLGRTTVWLLLPALALLGIAFFYPVVAMLSRSFTTAPGAVANYREVFGQDFVVRILLRSLWTAALVTVISFLIGYPYAYTAATTGRRARAFLLGVATASLFISIIVRSYAWLAILDRHGVINTVLGDIGLGSLETTLVHNVWGVLIGLVQYGIPFMVLSVYDSMHRFDERLRQAAATLGAPPRSAFFRVYFPATLPGVIAGCVIVFITTLGYYIIPSILGGPENTMIGQLIATEIRSLIEWGIGSAIATVLLAAALVAFVVFYRVSFRAAGARGNG